ncbi:MAG: GNAT family N-acetyltransferase [Polyangiales bacterium]
MTAAGEIGVRLLRPGEAPSLIALIRACYGETYIDPSFYDQGAIERLYSEGRLHSIGAFAASDRLVGHMGISMRQYGRLSADAGMTLVDPEFRGRGIARAVAVGLAQQSVALGLVGVHDYPVTVHAATQRIGAGFGIDTGLMLANVPADVEFHEIENAAPGARTNSLIRWLPFGRAPERTVYLPARYREQIESSYAAAHLQRRSVSADLELAPGAAELGSEYDMRRRILRIAVRHSADDLPAKVRAERSSATARGALLAHIDLPLGDPATPAAVEALRAEGFFFAGLLPELRDGDALRLQCLSDSVDDSASSVLSSDATRAIEAYVLDDRAACQA